MSFWIFTLLVFLAFTLGWVIGGSFAFMRGYDKGWDDATTEFLEAAEGEPR